MIKRAVPIIVGLVLATSVAASSPAPPDWAEEPGCVRHVYTFPDDSLTPTPAESDNPFGAPNALVVLGEFATGWQDPDPTLEPPAVSGASGHGAWDLGKGPTGAIRVTVPIGQAAADDNFISYEVRLQVNAVGYTVMTVLPSLSADGYSLADVGETDSAAFDDPYMGQWEHRTWTARIEDVVEDSVTLVVAADADWGSLIDTVEVYALAVAEREIRTAHVTIGNLEQTYDGHPKEATVTTDPDGLDYDVTYDGYSTPPTNAGNYQVVATVNEEYYVGAATNTLTIYQADPLVTEWPTAKTMLQGQTLADVELIGGASSMDGEFAFDDPGAEPPAGPSDFKLNFTPDDPNYAVVSKMIPVARVIATQAVVQNSGFPGKVVTVENTFDYPEGWTLGALAWAAELPEGWVIQSVSGDGGPLANGNDILFVGNLSARKPLEFTCLVKVGDEEVAGIHDMGATVEFYADGYEPGYTRPLPDPIEFEIYTLEDYVSEAEQGSRGFYSPSTHMGPMTVTNIFQAVGKLEFLAWAPLLPDGWALAEAGGDVGEPTASGGVVSFTVDSDWPEDKKIEFWYTVDVPGNMAVIQSIGAITTFKTPAMPQAGSYVVERSPAYRYHSADYDANKRILDVDEANRVVGYWRKGGYRPNPAGFDGYSEVTAPDSVAVEDFGRHSADYEGDAGTINVFEANRVMAYRRMGGYSVNMDDPDFRDGYTTGSDGAGPLSLHSEPSAASMSVEAGAYAPGETLTVETRIHVDSGNLWGLAWIPELPTGWRVLSVDGCGSPVLGEQDGAVLWVGDLPENGNVVLLMKIHVPLWEYRDVKLSGTGDVYVRGNNVPLSPKAQTDVLSFADRRGDGIPDVFGSPEEFITAGVELRIVQLRRTNAGTALRWLGSPGRAHVYTVERAEFPGGRYRAVEQGDLAVVEAIDNQTAVFEFTRQHADSAGFYRVRAYNPLYR